MIFFILIIVNILLYFFIKRLFSIIKDIFIIFIYLIDHVVMIMLIEVIILRLS
jgi:hypothetical protein